MPGHSTHNYTLTHTHTITYAAQPRGIHKHMTTVNKNWSQIISNIYSSKALSFWCTTSFPKSIPTRVSGWAVTAPWSFETALDEGRKRKNELYVKHGWGDQAADKQHLNWLTNTWRTKYELQQSERGGEREGFMLHHDERYSIRHWQTCWSSSSKIPVSYTTPLNNSKKLTAGSTALSLHCTRSHWVNE